VSSVAKENENTTFRMKTWQASPKGVDGGELEQAFRKTRKSVEWPPQKHKKQRENVTTPTEGLSSSRSTDENKEPKTQDNSTISIAITRVPEPQPKIIDGYPIPSSGAVEPSVIDAQEDAIHPTASTNENEETATQENLSATNEPIESKAARLLRLKRSKAAESYLPSFSSKIQNGGLKSSLSDAKVVLQEERSTAAPSDASTRSSLSNQELGDIANLALNMSKETEKAPTKQASKPVLLPSMKSLMVSRTTEPAISSHKGRTLSEIAKAATEESVEHKPGSKASRAGKLSLALKRAAAHDAMRSSQDKDKNATSTTDSAEEESIPAPPTDGVRSDTSEPVAASEKQPTLRARALSGISHQEARRALLTAAQKHKEKGKAEKRNETTEAVPSAAKKEQRTTDVSKKDHGRKDANEIAARLGFKASRVLAMKNSGRGSNRTSGKVSPPPIEDYEILTSGSVVSALSVESTKSRRANHPAFAARAASPRPGMNAEKSLGDPVFNHAMLKPKKDLTKTLGNEKSKALSGKKPFSEELFSSFRHFNASRTSAPEVDQYSPGSSFDHGRSTPNTVDLTTTFSGTLSGTPKATTSSEHSRPNDGRPPQYGSNSQQMELHGSLTPDEEKKVAVTDLEVKNVDSEQKANQFPRGPTTLRDVLSRRKNTTPQPEQREPPAASPERRDPKEYSSYESVSRDSFMSADRSASPESSPFLEQEDSLHSTSERNYLEGFYDIGRSRYTSKQSFQDVNYLSSLSSNTFSNQSIMSIDEKRKGGILGSTKSGEAFTSPMSFNRDYSQFAFRVEPLEGTSLLGTELPSTMSPGPSMRSGHSMAHSIISVSPRGDTPKGNSEFDYLRPSPAKRGRAELDPIETLPEHDDEDKSKGSEPSAPSSSHESADTNAPNTNSHLKIEEEVQDHTFQDNQAQNDGFLGDEFKSDVFKDDMFEDSMFEDNVFQQGTLQEKDFQPEEIKNEDFDCAFHDFLEEEFLVEEPPESVSPIDAAVHPESSNASNDAPNRPALLEPPEDPREGIQKSLSYKHNILSAISSSSMRSHSDSPPGFVFSDADKEKATPDPEGAPPDQYVIPEDLFGEDCESESDEEDRSFGTELKAGDLVADSTLDFESKNGIVAKDGSKPNDVRSSAKVNPSPEQESKEAEAETACKERSVSTKETSRSISTSLRSGLSSIQNAAAITTTFVEDVFTGNGMSPANGSTSMRTGLSSIQNPSATAVGAVEADDINGSSSTRHVFEGKMEMRDMEINISDFQDMEIKISDTPDVLALDTDIESQKSSSQHQSHHYSQRSTKVPDTIIEEEDESSGERKSKSGASPRKSETGSAVSTAKDDQALHVQSVDQTATTATTDASSDDISQSQSARDQGLNTTETTTVNCQETEPEPLAKIVLPRILTLEDNAPETVSAHEGKSLVSSPGSSKQSSKWWKKKKVGMKMAIKQVLSKASPRHGIVPSPMSRPQTQQNDFSSDDDDEEDDIFGGLEEDNTMDDMKKKPTNQKTPKARSQHSRKSESKVVAQVEDKNSTPRRSARGNSASERLAATKKGPRTPARDNTNKSRPNKDVIEKAAAKLKKFRPRPPSPATATNPNSLYSNDRSGTVLDESEVLEGVNSDITSSLLAGNGPYGSQNPAQKAKKKTKASDKLKVDVGADSKIEQRVRAKTPKTPATAGPKSTASNSGRTHSSRSSTKALEKASEAEKTTKPKDESKAEEKADEESSTTESEPAEESPKAASGSIFMSFGCGFVDTWTNACQFGTKVNLSEDVLGEDGLGASFASGSSLNSQSQLTDLEKRIWSDWDRLDANIKTPTQNDEATVETKKEEQEKKREAARGKLLEIAGSAISSQMSMTKEDERGASSDYTDDSSDSTESGDSSGVSGESGMTSTTSTTQDGPTESQSYYSGGTESDYNSNSPSSRKEVVPPPTSTPILLSFSQKSLVEKFTKQLATDCVEVLKLNTRKQWQIRYFTVSKEQIALTAHEANNNSKDVAQCPNALLWLKKFNPKNGGYGISNIDKNGHGGMMLVDLVDVHVSTKTDMENPIPKKLLDKFKDPVLLTLDYVMDGGKENRSIEFRCKNNDEAQFLCTCMRVIRDLLKREQSLRIKNSTHQR